MPLYEVTADQLKRIEETSFREARIRERADLQRLLRSQIEIVLPDALVIAEEFGEWEESRRRIDLLAIDKDANLVVVELKRTEDGGHMELQA
jgi:RecB family endonuclease NucS